MSWLSKYPAKTEIAQKDIDAYTYAIITPTEGLFQAILQPQVYRVDKLYETKISEPQRGKKGLSRGLYIIQDGFLSYDPTYMVDSYCVERFNEYLVMSMYGDEEKLVRLSCVIPAGSRYARSETGEFVSDKIIVKNVEEIKED